MNRLRVCFAGLLFAACAAASPLVLTEEAAVVQVGKSDPPDNYEFLEAITVHDGHGCGLLGRRGTYERAITALRLRAAEVSADYVAITTVTEPYLATRDCFVNRFIVNGMAYRRTAEFPSPVPIQSVDTKPAAADLVDQLHKLSELHQSGVLTDEEFERAKARLLDGHKNE